MGYKKANTLLPRHLLWAVQQYIDGACLYIPRRDENKKAWGENTDTRHTKQVRNMEIAAKYTAGCSVSDLAEQYFLSAKTIYKIISATKGT